jgi:hypothetical protein
MANQGAAYIMGSDKTSVNDPMGSNQLHREGLEFTTETNPDVLTQDMPKQQTKPTVEASLFAMAEQRDY